MRRATLSTCELAESLAAIPASRFVMSTVAGGQSALAALGQPWHCAFLRRTLPLTVFLRRGASSRRASRNTHVREDKLGRPLRRSLSEEPPRDHRGIIVRPKPPHTHCSAI